MKIRISGRRTTADIRQLLNNTIDRMEANGITECTGINFYFNPYDADCDEVELLNDNGNPISGWEYPAPKKSRKLKTDKLSHKPAAKSKRPNHLKLVGE